MKLPLIAGALAVVAATAAFAGDPMNKDTSADSKATFKSLDMDGNGRISANEARAHAELSAGYQGAVSDSAQGMTAAEFDTWAASRQSTTTPPRN